MFEAYVLIDADGDGLPERWKVIAAGSDIHVLRRYRVEDQPLYLHYLAAQPAFYRGFINTRFAKRFAEYHVPIL
jgi:hypothetical protein